ncbi:MAG: hypothetical protein NC301_07865 [Bacteroides sp.]|nr:hypothetical protein [Bacteroides sp.]MCM1380087.1 hypothetical protein [Bacteroides sp.]MCM1446424.1 hypothetical protein [Prevotella sp.]
MKKHMLLLAVSAIALTASAKLTTNTGYLMIPLTAGNGDVKHFVTGAADGSLTLSDNFTEAAVWNWRYVSGTVTTPGHYLLGNAATGQYLFTTEAKTSADEISIKEAVSAANDAAHTFMANDTYLAVSSTGAITTTAVASGTDAAFLMLGYVATMTAEEIEQAAKDAVAVAYGIPEAVNQLLPMLQASYTGTRQAQNALNVLYKSQTVADIQTQLTEVRRTAVRMLESDLENGATWQQKSSGKLIPGTWYGKFTDNGNSKVENRQFALYNSDTKTYLVNTDGEISTSAESGTLWTIAYFYGEGLAIAPADENPASATKLLYPNSEGKLIIGSNKADALIYIGEINMFGDGINSVKPIGATEDNDGETVYTSINAIELTVVHGATPAANGILTLTLTSDETITTLEIVDATAAKDPVTKKVAYDYYDNTGTHQTGEAEVDVYTIPLSETYTDGGVYIVRVNMGAFTLDGALSKEMAGFTEVNMSNLWSPTVTPAEGDVTALSLITITGANGIYPNAKAPADASVDINCDGETKKMFYTSDFEQGGDFDTYNINDPSAPWFTIPVDFTEPGRYSLYIPRSFFIDNASNPCDSFSVVWEITEEGGIKEVESGEWTVGSGEAFDLLGRPATRGLLILKNGTKILRR